MIQGYIESELQSALACAKPGDDVIAILIAFNATGAEPTRLVRIGADGRPVARKPRESKAAMFRAACSESGIDVSLTARGDVADFDGVYHALSEQGARPTTPLEAWERLTVGVRSVGDPRYLDAIRIMQSVPGFERLMPCGDAIEARLDAASADSLDEVPF